MRNRKQLKIKDMTFYYVDGQISTIVGLKDLNAISGLKPVKYLWVGSNSDVKQQMSLQLVQKGINIELVDTVQNCEDEVKQTSNQYQSVSLICTDIDTLEALNLLFQSVSQVKSIYYFSLMVEDVMEKYMCDQMINQGKLCRKVIPICKGQLSHQLLSKVYFPNFLYLGSDNQRSNLQKTNLSLIVQQKFDHKIMVNNMKQIIKYINRDRPIQPIQNFIRSLQSAQRSFQNFGTTIKYYTQQGFLYKLVNNLLRKGQNPTQLFYIQPFVKNLFYAINRLFSMQTQNKKYQWMKQLTCYRGAMISPEELELFKENVGECVECLGFLSTSKNYSVAKMFALRGGYNALIKVQIQNVKRDFNIDYGYAYIEQFTAQQGEEQVLFNMLNSFLIKSYQFNKQQNRTEITLVYGVAAQVSLKYKNKQILSEDQARINSTLLSQEYTIKRYYCQGANIYQYNLFVQSEYYASQQYFSLQQQILKPISKTETQNCQYFASFFYKARLYLRQNKMKQFYQNMAQVDKLFESCKNNFSNQDYHSLMYLDIQRTKAEALIYLQKYAECLVFLVHLKKMDQAYNFLQEIKKYGQANKNTCPQLYETIKTIENNLCLSTQKKEKQKVKKAKYITKKLCQLGKTSKKLLDSFFNFSLNFVGKSSQSKKDDQKFFLLRIQNILYEVEEQNKKGRSSSTQFGQKLSQLLPLLRNFPNHLKCIAYGLSLLSASQLLFSLFRFRQSLQMGQLCLEMKTQISDEKHLKNLGTISILKIGLGQEEAGMQIKSELEAYKMFEDVEKCLVEIDCILQVKKLIKDIDQSQLQLLYNKFGEAIVDRNIDFLIRIADEMNEERKLKENQRMEERTIQMNQKLTDKDKKEMQEQKQKQKQSQEQRKNNHDDINRVEIIETAKELIKYHQHQIAIQMLEPISVIKLENMSDQNLVNQVGIAKYLQAFSLNQMGQLDKANTKYEQAKKILQNYPTSNILILYQIHKIKQPVQSSGDKQIQLPVSGQSAPAHANSDLASDGNTPDMNPQQLNQNKVEVHKELIIEASEKCSCSIF